MSKTKKEATDEILRRYKEHQMLLELRAFFKKYQKILAPPHHEKDTTE